MPRSKVSFVDQLSRELELAGSWTCNLLIDCHLECSVPRILVLLSFVVPTLAWAAQQPPSAEDYIALVEGPQNAAAGEQDTLSLIELMDELGVPGMSVAVIKDFEVHWAKGYGTADVEAGAAVRTDTLFQAGSISKPVAAMAVLKAAENGHLSLDTDINEILTSWQLTGGAFTANQAVTPRSLTSHTAGFGDGFGFPGYLPGASLPTTVQILNGDEPSNVGPVLLERAPYVAMQYSGGGVMIMQLALEDATQRSLADLSQDYIFESIGMTESTFAQPLSSERDQNAARAHDENGEAMDAKWNVYPELAAAGLWTTPTDLAKFVIEVQKTVYGEGNGVLSTSSVQAMLNPVGVGEFAVGFRIIKRGEGWYFEHGGGTRGFRAQLIGHKLKGYGLVVMTNGEEGLPLIQQVGKRIAEAYSWDALTPPTGFVMPSPFP